MSASVVTVKVQVSSSRTPVPRHSNEVPEHHIAPTNVPCLQRNVTSVLHAIGHVMHDVTPFALLQMKSECQDVTVFRPLHKP
jgi:hypothetical protein